MEVLFGVVSSCLLGFILSEIKTLRYEVNQLENKILKMEMYIKKRKEDFGVQDDSKMS